MLDKKAVMIIAPMDFRDEELFEPKAILEQAGVTVTIASSNTKPCIGMLRGTVTPDLSLYDVKIENFDAIIFVGGSGASCYWDDPVAHKIIQQAVMYNKVVGAICIAPVTLANAGVLYHKRVTAWKTEEDKLSLKGAFFTGKRVSYDGNIITANGPESAEQFGKSLVKALETIE